MAKGSQESEDFETEEVDGDFVEVSLAELAQLCAESPYQESPPELTLVKDKHRYRFFLNTPMGFREVDKLYVRLTDVVAEQAIDGPVN